ncbi:MAG: hypothetical protein HC850_15150 [Rhodomicrobium sp.]|nr:hypothetical protein [Rhodomicrobium sp.]
MRHRLYAQTDKGSRVAANAAILRSNARKAQAYAAYWRWREARLARRRLRWAREAKRRQAAALVRDAHARMKMPRYFGRRCGGVCLVTQPDIAEFDSAGDGAAMRSAHVIVMVAADPKPFKCAGQPAQRAAGIGGQPRFAHIVMIIVAQTDHPFRATTPRPVDKTVAPFRSSRRTLSK